MHPQNLAVWYKTPDDLTIHRPNHRGIFYSIETVQSYEMNSHGMRDVPHELEKPHGTFRVLVLGDSFMEALQVPFEQSFCRLLEAELKRETGQPVEVINAGVAGWGTDEELTYFERYGARFQPDLVLTVTTLHNDIYDNLEQNYHVWNGQALVSRPVQEIPFLAYKIWQVKAYLSSHSHLYQLARMWWHADEMEQQGRGLSGQVVQLLKKESDKNIETGWRLTEQLYQELQRQVMAAHAQSAIVLIPLAIQVEKERLAGFLHEHELRADMIEVENPQQRVKSIAQALNVPVIDLLPRFRKWTEEKRGSLYLRKDGHWTEEGHRLAASLVTGAVVPIVLNPSRQ